ncbi:MAG TPA: hypothetical protein VK503_05065, partial [Candidatus Bathyarchaeia archaeon]|nr:hypothetical protein [Candidatus Bathyarchaeia archaeon]
PFAEVIKQYLAKVGIDVQLQLVENTTFFSLYEINPQGFGDNVAMGIQTFGTGPDPVTIFDWIVSRPTGFGGENSGFYSNPTVDKLLIEAQNSVNYTLRKANYFQVQSIMANEVPMIFLFNNWKLEVWKNTFNGFKDTERPIGWYGNHRGVWWTQGKPLATTGVTSATTGAQPPTGGVDVTTIGAIVVLIVVVAGAALYMSKRKKTTPK